MTNRLKNKVAIVTGGASGIGEGIVERFIEEGAKVIVADISGQQDSVADRMGKNCLPIQVDVSNSEDIQRMIKFAVESFGTLDILCNNAAIEGALAPTGEYSEDEFDKVWSINGRSAFLGMRYAIPIMVENGGGSIINMVSMAAQVAFPNMPAYCAAKGAVKQLGKCAAAEYAAQGVRVNSICPGSIQTKITDALPPEYIGAIIDANPVKRIGQPREVGDLAVFLGSDESKFITGTEILIDGGYTAL